MTIVDILVISVSLAMDAFAVSICKGLSMKKLNIKKMIVIAAYFGIFQALMPVVGFCVGSGFQEIVNNIDHWIAFILLLLIGGNMIRESLSKKEEEKIDDSIGFKTMIVLAIATSIDALAVGVTFAFLEVNIILAIFLIGIITFILCLFGVIIGNKIGDKFEKTAELLGGAILIIIGTKILLEHLGIWFF